MEYIMYLYMLVTGGLLVHDHKPPRPPTDAECSVMQSSKVCDELGYKTAERRVAPSGYYLQGRQSGGVQAHD